MMTDILNQGCLLGPGVPLLQAFSSLLTRLSKWRISRLSRRKKLKLGGSLGDAGTPSPALAEGSATPCFEPVFTAVFM